MSANKTETTLAYRIDARGLQEARRQFVATFKTDILKAWNKDAAGVSKTIGALASAQKSLNSEMGKIKGAVENYQRLGKAIGSVTTAYGKMQTAAKGAYGITGVGEGGKFSANAYAAPIGPAPPRRMGAGTRGFFQGLAPNIGQYLDAETSPEARRQLAGQWAGSTIRRGIGGAINATSGMLAGQGPLSTMFGNLPFIGGAASQAEAMAGSALGNYQARLNAFPTLGSNLGTSGHWEGRTAATSSITHLSKEEREQRRKAEDAKISATLASIEEHSQGSGHGSIYDPRAELYEPIQTAIQRRQIRAGGKTLTPGNKGKYVAGTGYSSIGGKLGMDETASIQMAGQLGSQIGGAGAMSPDRFAQILGGQTMGVEAGASAGLLRQMQAGRGGMGGKDTLAKTIGDAVSMGMENSEIAEYLENISSLQEQASQRGVRISTEGFSSLVGSIAGTGIGGIQGQRIAAGMQQAAMNTANTGVRGPADVQMARAFGYDPKNPGSYITALKAMEEEGMSPTRMKDFVSKISSGTSGDAKAFTIKRALGSMGVNATFAQSGQMGAGNFANMPSLPGAPKNAGDLSGRLDSDVIRGLTGALRDQAGIQNTLLAAGKNMLPVVQELQGSAANLSRTISTFGPILKTNIADPIAALSHLIQDLLTAARSGMTAGGT